MQEMLTIPGVPVQEVMAVTATLATLLDKLLQGGIHENLQEILTKMILKL